MMTMQLKDTRTFSLFVSFFFFLQSTSDFTNIVSGENDTDREMKVMPYCHMVLNFIFVPFIAFKIAQFVHSRECGILTNFMINIFFFFKKNLFNSLEPVSIFEIASARSDFGFWVIWTYWLLYIALIKNSHQSGHLLFAFKIVHQLSKYNEFLVSFPIIL